MLPSASYRLVHSPSPFSIRAPTCAKSTRRNTGVRCCPSHQDCDSVHCRRRQDERLKSIDSACPFATPHQGDNSISIRTERPRKIASRSINHRRDSESGVPQRIELFVIFRPIETPSMNETRPVGDFDISGGPIVPRACIQPSK